VVHSVRECTWTGVPDGSAGVASGGMRPNELERRLRQRLDAPVPLPEPNSSTSSWSRTSSEPTGARDLSSSTSFCSDIGTTESEIRMYEARSPAPRARSHRGRCRVALGGTGGLTNLQAQGTFEGTGATGTYSLQITFAP
jgi:hypothetical protein